MKSLLLLFYTTTLFSAVEHTVVYVFDDPLLIDFSLQQYNALKVSLGQKTNSGMDCLQNLLEQLLDTGYQGPISIKTPVSNSIAVLATYGNVREIRAFYPLDPQLTLWQSARYHQALQESDLLIARVYSLLMMHRDQSSVVITSRHGVWKFVPYSPETVILRKQSMTDQ